MAAEAALMEALLRVEHKLDIMMRLHEFKLPQEVLKIFKTPVGDPNHRCPLCEQPVKYILDQFQKVVSRQCGCKTGLLAPMDLNLFAPPASPAKETRDASSDHGPPDLSDDRRGRRGPR